MAEPRFADDDDLPRTLRRERDARERDAREREMREREMPAAVHDEPYAGAAPQSPSGPAYGYDYGSSGDGAVTVTRLKIPFVHLMLFFIKAVVAAIPALILMALLFWGAGEALRIAVPSFKGIHITVWQAQKPLAQETAVEAPKPAPEPRKR